MVVVQGLDHVFQDPGDGNKRFDGSPVGDRPRRVVVEQGLGKRLRRGRSGTFALPQNQNENGAPSAKTS